MHNDENAEDEVLSGDESAVVSDEEVLVRQNKKNSRFFPAL